MACPVLFGRREICRGVACNLHRFRLHIHAFVPGRNCVLAVGYACDLVAPISLRYCEIWRRGHNDVGGHLRMDVAQQRYRSGSIELEYALLSRWPGPEVVAQLLISADRGPEDVVRHFIA